MNWNHMIRNRSMVGILGLLGVMLLSAQTGIARPGEWSFTKIDNCPYTAQFFGSTVRLDSGGRPQVLFQRDPNYGSGLAHARIEGNTWKIQTKGVYSRIWDKNAIRSAKERSTNE